MKKLYLVCEGIGGSLNTRVISTSTLKFFPEKIFQKKNKNKKIMKFIDLEKLKGIEGGIRESEILKNLLIFCEGKYLYDINLTLDMILCESIKGKLMKKINSLNGERSVWIIMI